MTSLGTRSSGPSRPSQGHPRTHLPRVTVLTTHLLRVTVLTTLPGRVSGLRRRGETRQRLPEPPAWRVLGLGVTVLPAGPEPPHSLPLGAQTRVAEAARFSARAQRAVAASRARTWVPPT